MQPHQPESGKTNLALTPLGDHPLDAHMSRALDEAIFINLPAEDADSIKVASRWCIACTLLMAAIFLAAAIGVLMSPAGAAIHDRLEAQLYGERV